MAYYLHWPLSDIMNLEHKDRRSWVDEISKINKKIKEDLLHSFQ